jgi:hypothetical protein
MSIESDISFSFIASNAINDFRLVFMCLFLCSLNGTLKEEENFIELVEEKIEKYFKNARRKILKFFLKKISNEK